MSDEEWVTTDDLSSETESLHDEYGEKCPYCGIWKVMAESRLFKVPAALKDELETWTLEDSYCLQFWEIPDHYTKVGSNKGCQFCGLLVDATTAWEKEQGVCFGYPLGWALEFSKGRFLISLGVEHPYGLELVRRASIFRGTGMCFHQSPKGRI
jgi:hypothetical protein